MPDKSIKNKIKHIKYTRMKPEERFMVNIINNLVESDTDTNKVKFKLYNTVVFSYDRRYKHLWYSFDLIHGDLLYMITDAEIPELVKRFVNEYLIKEEILHINHGSPRKSNKI